MKRRSTKLLKGAIATLAITALTIDKQLMQKILIHSMVQQCIAYIVIVQENIFTQPIQ